MGVHGQTTRMEDVTCEMTSDWGRGMCFIGVEVESAVSGATAAEDDLGKPCGIPMLVLKASKTHTRGKGRTIWLRHLPKA